MNAAHWLPGLDTCTPSPDSGWIHYRSNCPDAWWWWIDWDGVDPGTEQFWSLYLPLTGVLAVLAVLFTAFVIGWENAGGGWIGVSVDGEGHNADKFMTLVAGLLIAVFYGPIIVFLIGAALWHVLIVFFELFSTKVVPHTPQGREIARAATLEQAKQLLAANDDAEFPITRSFLEDCVTGLERGE